MKKRIFVWLLVCVFAFGALPVHAAQEARFSVCVQPSQQQAAVGDTVYYSVVAEGEDVVALQFDLVIPDGMRYVSGSGATPEGLRDKLGVAAADWTEGVMRFTYYNDVGVTIAKGTVLLTFACVAETAGSHQVTLVDVLPFDSEFMEFTPSVQFDTLSVSNEGASETQDEQNQQSGTQPTQEPEPTEESSGNQSQVTQTEEVPQESGADETVTQETETTTTGQTDEQEQTKPVIQDTAGQDDGQEQTESVSQEPQATTGAQDNEPEQTELSTQEADTQPQTQGIQSDAQDNAAEQTDEKAEEGDNGWVLPLLLTGAAVAVVAVVLLLLLKRKRG